MVTSDAAGRPNVLIILTDDQRFDTINALGNHEIYTPNLDRLVRRGLAFENGYIMGGSHPAICMPSRAMLNTGRDIFSLERCGYAIPPEHVTLGEAFRRAGYHTIGIGKWHNGVDSYARSFTDGDEILFAGMEDHWHVPLNHFRPDGDYPPAAPFRTRLHIGRDKEVVERSYDHIYDDRHSSEIFADAAVNMIGKYRDSDRPFCLYLATMAPHDPRTMPDRYRAMYDPDALSLPENFLPEHPFDKGDMKLRDEYLAPFPRTPEAVRREKALYYAMITHLDEMIGRVLDALDETGQAENTLVVLAGDNGLAMGSHGLMGKQSLYEHSVRVPFILAGPGIARGAVSKENVVLNQIYPTLCDLCGVPVPASVQFESLRDQLTGGGAPDGAMFFAYTHCARAVKRFPYKLIEYLVDGKRVTQLFDLEADPHEINNLAPDPAYREAVRDLRAELHSRQTALGDPMAGRFGAYAVAAPVAGRATAPARMHAVVCRAIFEHALCDAPVPESEPGGALVRVRLAAVTPADRMAYAGSPRDWGNGDPAAFLIPPVVPLGEFVGVLDGPMCGLAAGTRVTVEPVVPGEAGADRRFGFMTGMDGGAAEWVALPRGARAHAVPDALSDEAALYAHDVALALRAVEAAAVKPDDVVIATVDGAAGLAVLQGLRDVPCRSAVVFARDPALRALAQALVACPVIDPGAVCVPRDDRMMLAAGEFDMLDVTGPRGATVFLNTDADPKFVRLGLELLGDGGRYVECAVLSSWIDVDWSLIAAHKELTVRGVTRSGAGLGRALAWLMERPERAGAVPVIRHGKADWRGAFEPVAGKRVLAL